MQIYQLGETRSCCCNNNLETSVVYHTAEKQGLVTLRGCYGPAEAWLLHPSLGPRAASIWNIACLCGTWKGEAQHELGDVCRLCVLFCWLTQVIQPLLSSAVQGWKILLQGGKLKGRKL